MSDALDQSDAQLVALSLQGDPEAFARIVARYQSLICSLAYSASGSLSRSEDLAQETFLAAWKELKHLREPERLRAWLCAIARNRVQTAFRKQQREPAHAAEVLEESTEIPTGDLAPAEHAISAEEEAILWRSLEQIPETYREPLILFYRQDQSVARVAQSLELSEDAVKKRLIRGRKMLQDHVLAFVAGSLRQTTPGKAFTLGVVSALPLFAASSVTAATLTGTAKASSGAKVAAGLGLGITSIGAIAGLLGAISAPWIVLRQANSPYERRWAIRFLVLVGLLAAFFVAGLLILIEFGHALSNYSHAAFGCAIGAWTALYCGALALFVFNFNRKQERMRVQSGVAGPLTPDASRVFQQAENLSKREIYGSVGGSTIGSLTWMLVQTVRRQDWTTTTLIVAFGVLVFTLASRAILRRPERIRRVLLQVIVALGIFTIVVCALIWPEWVGSMRE